jgi:hypothetical protein
MLRNSIDESMAEINKKAKELLLNANEISSVLGEAVSVIARDATHYHDLTVVLKEFLRQRNYWVAEHSNGAWVVLHMALADNHPKQGAQLSDPIYFQNEAEAYRCALESVAPYDAEIDSYAD